MSIYFRKVSTYHLEYYSLVDHLDVLELLVDLLHFSHTLLQNGTITEHGRMVLHASLHLEAQISGLDFAVGMTNLIQIGNRELAGILYRIKEKR